MLRRFLLALTLSTALVSANASSVQAAPAIAAVGAFLATPIGAVVGNIALSIGASLGSTLIQQFFAPKSPSSTAVAGIRGAVASGGDVPLGFVMGYRMTAGSFAYRGTWGSAGKTPNAYYVEERILSDLPMPNRPAIWVGDKKVTVDWEAEPTLQGYPIVEGRKGGKDHWWVRYHDGSQTAADAYMRQKFGTHEDHPYGADMIGRGQAKVIVTFLVNKDLLKTWPKLKFETDGIPLYDISKDTTAGGDGLHRIDDPSTWEPSSLLPVQIYNALIGIRHDGEWVWGGQNIGPGRLPTASWIAAIAEARASVALAGGGTEQQFRGGFEVTGNMEPQAFIKEALKGCAGRMAEIGGIYKILCGVPPSSVFTFTDADIIVTREQGYDHFPVLEETHNAIRATYPEPAVGWATKDAPARYSSELEAEDMGRQLAIDVAYEMVFSGTQVQRLMSAAIEEARRFRKHGFALPPEASELEPLDVVSWTSAANGYTAKKFIITDMDDEPTYLQALNLQEIDPADYDFDPETDELPWTVGELGTTPLQPQQVSDWAVAPYQHVGAAGVGRRPGIKYFWDGDQDDVRALQYQVRLPVTEELVLSGEFASSFTDGQGVTPAGGVLSDEDYETRGRYDPISDRPSEWTAWTPVRTPLLPDADIGPLVPEQLGPELAAGFGLMIGSGPGSLAELMQRWEDQLDQLAGAVTTATMTSNVIRESLVASFGAATAAIMSERLVRASATEALASQINQVVAQLPNILAGGFLRMEGVVSEDEASATVQFKAFAELEGMLSQSTALLRASVNSEGGVDAFFGVLGSFHVFATPDGAPIPVLTVDALTGEVTMSVANIGEVRSGLVRDAEDTFRFDLDNMRIYRTDGNFDIDAKNMRIRIRKPVSP